MPPRWRRYLPQLILLVVGLTAVLVVRGIVRDDGADGDGTATEQPAPTTDATDGEGDASSSTAPPTAAPSEALVDAALRLSDLPSGWVEASESSGIELCPDADPVAAVPPTAAHQVAFTGGASGPFLASTVAEFRDEARAERFMAAATDAMDTCDRYERDGNRYELERFTVRGLGEESAAARITGATTQGDVGGPIYYARLGRRVVTVAALTLGGETSDALARRAVEAVLARL